MGPAVLRICCALAAAQALGACSAWQIPSRETVERSFAPHRARSIDGEPVLAYQKRRCGLIVGGLGGEEEKPPGARGSWATAVAIAPDGYFLTALHAVSLDPLELLLPDCPGTSFPARVVWTHAGADAALIHADVKREAWFELAPDRPRAAGTTVLAFGFTSPEQGAGGRLEVAVDPASYAPYEALTLPDDVPLLPGFSGGPAILCDGELIGVHTATGMDTLFKRRSFIARPSPDLLQRLMAADRAVHRAAGG